MIDLTSLKTLFDSARGISLVVVQRVEVTEKLDEIRALCKTLPEENEIIARFAFPHCSQGNGFFALPKADDFGICLFPDDDTPIIVGYLPSEDDLMKIGVKAMQYLKDGYISAGFDSADKIFRNYDPLIKRNTKQMPTGQLPKTIEFRPGYAIIEVNIAQPIALMAGLFYGVAQMFGNTIKSLNYEEIDHGNFTVNRFTLIWQ